MLRKNAGTDWLWHVSMMYSVIFIVIIYLIILDVFVHKILLFICWTFYVVYVDVYF